MDITDDLVRDDVRGKLAQDPRLPYPDEIAVDAERGIVTLRGTVGSFSQLRAAVAEARRPADAVDVTVKDGWLTLTGQLDFQFQSDVAFERVASLKGVTGVTNAITVVEAR